METETGYITLSRKFFRTIEWRTPRTFNESEAWLDCIQSARFEPSELLARVGGRDVKIRRGEWAASQRFLSKRWQWSDRKVRTFIDRLRKSGMIETESRDGVTIIRLLNYDKYNPVQESCDAVNDAPITAANELSVSELIINLTQQVTQLAAQLAEMRRKPDAKLINENKDNIKKDCPYGQPKESGVPPLSAEPTRRAPGIDFDAFMEFYNQAMADRAIPAIKSLSDKRRLMLGARAREHGKEALAEVVRKAAASSFLNGGGDRAFVADFDWIFRPGNFLKILEGSYDNNDNNYEQQHAVRRTTYQQQQYDNIRACEEDIMDTIRKTVEGGRGLHPALPDHRQGV